MHMADALVSPAVGGAMWAVAGGAAVYSARKLRLDLDERKVPLMGVMGAFVFAAQMINFAIPATGSSGHLGGGMLLAILLGPHAAFIAIASVLAVQALFFADGGLLALGCNIVNLGLIPCFCVYPLVFRPLAGRNPSHGRLLAGTMIAAVTAVELGALAVVLETVLSGVSDLPFATFLLLMLPIHLAIGLVEGAATFAVVRFVRQLRPDVLEHAHEAQKTGLLSHKALLACLGAAAVLIAGGLSWFASSDPDGLEWSMAKTSGQEELEAPDHAAYTAAEHIQNATALLPDYDFKNPPETAGAAVANVGTSVAGLVGAGLTLAFVGAAGLLLRARRGEQQRSAR